MLTLLSLLACSGEEGEVTTAATALSWDAIWTEGHERGTIHILHATAIGTKARLSLFVVPDIAGWRVWSQDLSLHSEQQVLGVCHAWVADLSVDPILPRVSRLTEEADGLRLTDSASRVMDAPLWYGAGVIEWTCQSGDGRVRRGCAHFEQFDPLCRAFCESTTGKLLADLVSQFCSPAPDEGLRGGSETIFPRDECIAVLDAVVQGGVCTEARAVAMRGLCVLGETG